MSKKQVDSLIRNAKTEDQLMKDITQLAVKSHGEDAVNTLIDGAVDELDLQEKITKLASTPYQSKIEKAGVRALEAFQPIAKGVSHVTTPILESVRGPFQYIAQNVGEDTSQTPPIDPLAEWEKPLGAPTGRGSMTNLLTDISNAMGIQQAPLTEVDIEGFPATSEALTQLSNPAEFTAALLEGLSGSKLAKIPGTEKVGLGARLGSIAEDIGTVPGVKKAGEVASEFYPSSLLDPLTKRANKREMIKNYVVQAARDRGLLDDIMASGQFEYMVDMLENNPDLIQPFNQRAPLDIMEGPIVSGLNPETSRMTYRRAPEQGQLGKLAAQQASIIEEIPPKYNVNREDFLASVLNELPGGLDESQRASAEKLIRESVSPISRDAQKLAKVLEGEEGINFDPTIPDEAAYNEFIYNLNQAEAAPFLNQQRKTGNVYIDQTSPFVDPRDVAARTQAGRALESAASQGLRQPMSELSNVSRELYSDTNRAISARRDYRDLLTGARSAKDHFGKVVPQGDIERGVVAKMLGLGDEYLVPSGHKIANYLQRQGVQYGNAGAKLAPISLQSYRIPRNSQKIQEQKDYVVSKIGKELGPQYANDLMMIEDPEAVKLFMRNVELTRPDLFEKDPYARFDGVIEHPLLKQKALEDTVKNNNVSVLDKANTVEELLVNNRFLG